MSTATVTKFILFSIFALTASNPIPTVGSGMFGRNFQGDIKLNIAQQRALIGINRLTGWTHSSYRWPTLRGFVTVPYRIQQSEGFSKLIK
jgi:hypothetical protein